MQYLTLALDASCDLPKAIYQRFDLATLPVTWLANPAVLPPDDRSKAITDAWYQTADHPTRDALPELHQDTHLSQRLNDSWLLQSDGTLVITPAKHRHPGYHHWNHQAATLQPQLDRLRHAANLHSHFRLRVMDSGHTLAAYGLLVQVIAHLHRDQGLTIDKLRLPLLAFAPRIRHFYSVPAFANPMLFPHNPTFPPLNWLKRSIMAHQKTFPVFQVLDGEDTMVQRVDLVQAALEESRLSHSAVNASFAGDIEPLQQHPAIRRLHQIVTAQGGNLWLSPMAGSSACLFGRNAFSLALVN